MRTNRSVPAGVAVLLGVVAILSVLIPALHAPRSSAAGATPPWEPDTNSAAPYGNLVFYDSSGNVLTSGSNLDHLFDFASGTTAADTGATKATLYFAAPNHANPTGAWAVVQASASTAFNGQTFPGSVAAAATAGDPVVTLTASDADLASQLGALSLDSSTGYANIIQVRLKDSGPSAVSSGSNYWSADIAYNTGTSAITVDGVSVPPSSWVQIYPSSAPKTTTATSITTTASSVTAGSPVTYTATVTPTPDGGTVDFNDGSGNPATTSCSAQPIDTTTGSATCQVTYTANGTYTVNANYSGSSSFAGSMSSSPATVTVTGGTTRTATTITLAPTTSATTGSQVIYTATVSPTPDGGTVAFDDGSGNPATVGCASQPVDTTAGTSTCTVTYTTAGSFAVNASYSGDSQFGPATTSAPQTQTITQPAPAATSTTVTSDTTPSSVVGQKVTYTATVTATGSGTGTPTGTVTFNDGSTAICTAVPLSGAGTATCQQTPSTAATETITAVYTNTDGTFVGSTSPSFSQLVKPAETSVAVTSSQNPASTGQMVTFTATVTATSPGSGTPTGTVDFSDGTGNPASSCSDEALTNGAATCTVTYTAAASNDQVSATYHNVDGNFTGSSTSSPLAETVQASASLPGAPGGVQGTAGDGQVALTWTVPTTNASSVTGYNVFQGTSAGAEASTPVNSTPLTATSYTVTGLTDGTKYYFTVKAVGAGGSSPASTEVAATPTSTSRATTTTSTTTTGTTLTSLVAPGGATSQDPTASATQSSGSLPFTGFKTTASVAAALLMVGVGIFLVGLARNRKKLDGEPDRGFGP